MPNERGTPHTALGRGSEFDLVRRLLTRWGDQARGIGDDAAVLQVPPGQQLVASTDTSVDGVHFRREWLAAREIGWRAVMAALSDLAAMGAAPLGILLAFVIPPPLLPLLDDLADGIGEATKAGGTVIFGGDLSKGDLLSISVTVFGGAATPVHRSGAVPGQLVYVTGRLGGAGSALSALQRGESPTPEHRLRFARPRARLLEGQWLASAGATALIDISDGLAADLGHVAAASQVRLEIDLSLLPTIGGVRAYDAARSGEEYELVAVSTGELDKTDFAQRFGLDLTRIGTVSAANEPEVRFTSNGAVVDLASGYDHFSS